MWLRRLQSLSAWIDATFKLPFPPPPFLCQHDFESGDHAIPITDALLLRSFFN